jgi:hypothetical protein
MPTSIEYGLILNGTGHALLSQNGAGSGPPDQVQVLVQNGAGTGPPHQSQAETRSGEWMLTAPLTALLLITAIVTAVRRRVSPWGRRDDRRPRTSIPYSTGAANCAEYSRW